MAGFVPLKDVYLYDVDLLTWASSDYHLLVPSHQRPAWGVDGVLDAAAPWVLTSATTDFAARGCLVGSVCRLSGGPGSAFPPAGDLLAVMAAAAAGLTLGRSTGIFRPDGLAITGQPPAVAGATGVKFEVLTLYPQIEAATYQVNRETGLTVWNGVVPADLLDPREMVEITAYRVLASQYFDRARANTEAKDDFLAKSKWYTLKYEAMREKLIVHIQDQAGGVTTGPPLVGRLVR